MNADQKSNPVNAAQTVTSEVARTKEHWAVLGGGILGMTVALRLAQQGHRVTLMEGRQHLGGLADAWTLGDITWDRHYHVTLLSDSYARGLLKELHLEDQMEWVETKTGFFTDGRLHSMSNSLEFLQFPPLSLIDKFRLGATIFYASRVKNWQALEQIPVADWLRKLSGKQTFEKMWLPLLRAKLGDCWRDTSAAFIWATIARMYAARRTGLKKEMFGYVRGGYDRIMTEFTRELQKQGVTIRCNAAVRAVQSLNDGRIAVHLADEIPQFDRVVSTLPSPVTGRLCSDLPDSERQCFENVRYHGIVCASVLLKKSLSPYYVTNITDSGYPFTAVIEMTSLVKREHLGGHALVYLPKYVTPDDEIFDRTDAEIEHEFLAGLQRMHPDLSLADVEAFRVSRVRHVFALPTLNYSKHLPPIRTSVPNLFAVNSSHIVNGTLNVNESIRLAEDFVTSLADSPRITSQQPNSRPESREQLVPA